MLVDMAMKKERQHCRWPQGIDRFNEFDEAKDGEACVHVDYRRWTLSVPDRV